MAPSGANEGNSTLMRTVREEQLRGKPSADLELGPLPAPGPLIPEGEYCAVSVSASVLTVFKSRRLKLVFQIHGGKFDETRLPWYCKLPPKGGRPSQSSHFFRAWLLIMGRDLRRGERPSIDVLIAKMFRVRVETVTEDHQRDPLPQVARYSWVSKLLERL